MVGQTAQDDLHLTDTERDLLRRIAQNSIEHALFGKKEEIFEIPESLKKKRGAFVCLKTKGELKGCIGYIREQMPLDETVRQMAVEAAFHDPRFVPLDESEWRDTHVEISVLTPMRKIDSVEEVQVGVHGLYVENGMNSGLLLPQVATENNWERDTFLEYACMKAGLPRNAWKSEKTDIYVFAADVF
jgi:AmmeMemoRadiSam system protein A